MRENILDKLRHGPLFIIFSLVCIYLTYILQRESFSLLILSVCFLFFLYTLIYKKVKSASELSLWLLFSFLIRFLVLFSFPEFSDDIFRFYWDGLCSNAGISPFSYTPTELIESGNRDIPGIDFGLYAVLNSPDYYSVYPAFLQHIFSLGARLAGPENIVVFSMLLKGVILFFEVGTVYLIIKLADIYKRARKVSLLYALNPLVILELNANIHFEAIMIFFILLTMYLWLKRRYWAGTAALSLGVAVKLVPLIFMPFLIKRVGWLRTIILGLFLIGLNVVFHLPFISADIIENMYSSVALYYNKFEFNASIYYIFRWMGYQYSGWNMIATIGKLLQVMTLISIFIIALMRNASMKDNLQKGFYWALLVFLLLSTTVHPWYLGPLLALGLFHFRSPLLWSGLIFLTYATYLNTPYAENLYFTFMEYLLVIPLIIAEALRKNNTSTIEVSSS